MQISYCLGGKFWENNLDIINKQGYNIIKLPTLYEFINTIPCYFTYKGLSNIDCCRYLNSYIASAYCINYIPESQKQRENWLKRYKIYNNDYFNFSNIKADFRILDILYQKGMAKYYYPINELPLPSETRILITSFWELYFYDINNIFKKDKSFFITNILPLINQPIPIPEDLMLKDITEQLKESVQLKNDYVIRTEEEVKEEVKVKEEEEVKEEVEVFLLGSKSNPHKKREDAKVGEFYFKKEQIVRRNK